ncbi:hypothetical protein BFJ71_g16163 [Fusarium oxysporum]|nr:hypothetical protein BFJ71_g16163 [Fusarium oxysporum]
MSNPGTNELIPPRTKRPRVNSTENDITDPVQPDTTTQSTGTIFNNCLPQQIPDQDVPKGDVYLGPSLPLAKELFSPKLWNAIRRVPDKENPDEMVAEMSTVFHENGNRIIWGCQIEIGIAKEHVSKLALLFFDTLLESINGIRSIPHSGECGSRVECTESFVLRGCRRDLSMFRGNLLEGICASPQYKREEKEARDFTDAVSMTIPGREEQDATICIHVGEWKASEIAEKIYRH